MNDTALAVVESQALADVSRVDLATFRTQLLPSEFAAKYLNAGAIPPEGLEEEIRHCYLQMQQTRLNPLLRQIHFVPRFDKKLGRHKLTAVTGIDGYRLLAERTGQRNGEEPPQWCGRDGRWRDCWSESGPPVAARVGVYRRGDSKAFWGVCHFKEYAAETPLWRSMPAQMLAKCAEAMAIRKAFPQETAGLYTDAEMDQALNPRSRKGAAGDNQPVEDQVVEAQVVESSGEPEGPATAEEAERFNAKFQEIAASRFRGLEQAAAWLRSQESDLAAAPKKRLGQLLALALKLPVEDEEARKKEQQLWGMLIKEKGLSVEEAYWWAERSHSWVHDPAKGRASANATPLDLVKKAVRELRSLTVEAVERIREGFAFWLDDQNRPEAQP